MSIHGRRIIFRKPISMQEGNKMKFVSHSKKEAVFKINVENEIFWSWWVQLFILWMQSLNYWLHQFNFKLHQSTTKLERLELAKRKSPITHTLLLDFHSKVQPVLELLSTQAKLLLPSEPPSWPKHYFPRRKGTYNRKISNETPLNT